MVKKHLNIILVLLILLVSLPISMAVAAKDKVAPVISQTKVTTNGDKDVAVSFNLSEKAKVSINVYQGTKLVKKGFDKVTSNAGKVTWSWKGSKAAATYTVKIEAADLAGNKAKTSSGSIKVTAPTNEDLNTKGVFNRSFNLTKAGAKYGPATGVNVINGKVTVKGNNITLKNLNINGTLVVDPGANGEAVLNNITAKKVEVLSGAPNSIKVYNLKAPILQIKNDNDVRIVSYAGTKIGQTYVDSGATLQTNGDASFGNIDIKVTNQKVKLDGTFSQVTVSGTDVRVEAGTGAVITTVKVVAPVVLSGDFSTSKVSVETNNIKVTVAASTQVKEIEVNEKATVTADSTAKITTLDVRADVKIEGTISGTVTISENNITYTLGEGAVVTDFKKEAGVTNVTTIYDQPVSSAPSITTSPSSPSTPSTPPPSSNGGSPDTTKPVLSDLDTNYITAGDALSISTNESGFLYIVPYDTVVTTSSTLEVVFNQGSAGKVAAVANGTVNFDTRDLLGEYKIYAVDSAGNISLPSMTIYINDTISVYSPPINTTDDYMAVDVYGNINEPITLKINNANGDVVKTLLSNRSVSRDETIPLHWDGKNDAGATVPDGNYFINLFIGTQTKIQNKLLIVDKAVPQLSNKVVTDKTKSHDGSISFDLSEDVYVDLNFYDELDNYVGHYKEKILGVSNYEFIWNGLANNIPVKDGKYKVEITLTDFAENELVDYVYINSDITEPNAPATGIVDNDDTEVFGVSEPGALVTLKKGTTILGTATADLEGKFSIPITPLSSYTYLDINATDVAGNVGYKKQIMVEDKNSTRTTTPQQMQVKINNHITLPDEIIINSLKPGDVFKVYDGYPGGNLIGSETVTSTAETITVQVPQLGTNAGIVYVSVTSTGKTESDTVPITYIAENVPVDALSGIVEIVDDIPGSLNSIMRIDVRNSLNESIPNLTANNFTIEVDRVYTNLADTTYFSDFTYNNGVYEVKIKGETPGQWIWLNNLRVNSILIEKYADFIIPMN